jgi:hypothetical protein
MKVSILNLLETCPVCNKTYLPQNDVCDCPEEPVVSDWEDIQQLNGLWGDGEVAL